MKLKFDKIKTLKAIECRDGTWMLEGAYYKMKNIEADTAMRESIAKPASAPANKPLK